LWKGQTIRETGAVGVRLTLVSPDGQAGFPGDLEATVTYKLTADNQLIMDYRAMTDKPTHVNLTNHTYWNLAGADSGNDVLAHRLMLNADHYLACSSTREIGMVYVSRRSTTQMPLTSRSFLPRCCGPARSYMK
jgi:aldose 1-epimerase